MAQKLTAAQRRALQQEAAGWGELSDEDFARLFTEGPPVRVRIRRPLPTTLTIALPGGHPITLLTSVTMFFECCRTGDASCWDLIPLCPKSPKDQRTTSCWNSPASI